MIPGLQVCVPEEMKTLNVLDFHLQTFKTIQKMPFFFKNQSFPNLSMVLMTSPTFNEAWERGSPGIRLSMLRGMALKQIILCTLIQVKLERD